LARSDSRSTSMTIGGRKAIAQSSTCTDQSVPLIETE
jgi:hypothetical protein